MAIGVFGLQVAYRLKRLEVMSTTNTHGWFGGGYAPTLSATVDRIDFSNDSSTASPRGALSLARVKLAATGNSNYGWFGGGNNPSALAKSTVDRIDFSNDSATASPRGPLSQARSGLGAIGNSNYGWFGGGFDQISRVTVVDRIDFSNDASAVSIRGPLSAGAYRHAATGNSNYGWFGGGFPAPALSTVDRIDFSNDSQTTSVRGPLSSLKRLAAATGNSNYGWFGGGTNPGATPTTVATVDRIDFSNDSVTASPRGPLSLVRNSSAATSGQAKGPAIKLAKTGGYGWWGGGYAPFTPFAPVSVLRSIVDRIDFSNDSVTASVRGSLISRKRDTSAIGNSNYGWFAGGNGIINPSNIGPLTTVDRIDFSNDSASASVRGPLSNVGRDDINGSVTGNSNYGWIGGGSPGIPGLSSVERIDFSNDSLTSIRGPLSSARRRLTATGNSNYGWYGGGVIGPFPFVEISLVDRINFSNDLATSSPRGLLSQARYQFTATGNSNYGWFGGGFAPAATATIDRIDFSNDTGTAVSRGSLSAARGYLAATGNSNYGWFGGGGPSPLPVATVDRIDFSNDSSTASVRGPLSLARNAPGATSNTLT